MATLAFSVTLIGQRSGCLTRDAGIPSNVKEAQKIAVIECEVLIDTAQSNCKEAFVSGQRISARIEVAMKHTNCVPGLN